MPLQVSGTKWGRTTKASVPSKAGRLISTEKGRNHFLGEGLDSQARGRWERLQKERDTKRQYESLTVTYQERALTLLLLKLFNLLLLLLGGGGRGSGGERRWMFPTSFFSLGCKWLRQTIILKNPFFSLVYKNHIWFTTLSILTALSNVRRTTVSWVRFALGARLTDPESPLYPFLVSSWHPPVLISRVVVERRLR